MPSSRWNITNYKTQLEKNVSRSPLLIEIKDEFVAAIFRQKIKKILGSCEVLFGNEITVELLENKLLGLNLFSFAQEEIFLIVNAHEISNQALEFLSHSQVDWQNKTAIFMATKNNKSLAKIFTAKGHCHYLDLPKFWQMHQYMDFFANYFGLTLAPAAKIFFVDSVEQSGRYYFEACHLLKSEYSQKRQISRADLEKTLFKSRLDQFALAQQLGEKNWRAFYQSLLNEEHSFDDLRQALSFLQTHVVKLLDPSYIQKKAQPTRYDRQIMGQKMKWQNSGLLKLLRHLAQLELACKQRDPDLKNRLRLNYLRLSAS